MTARAQKSSWLGGLDSLTANGAFLRYGPIYIATELAFLLCAVFFWLAVSQGSGAFIPEMWGAWACQFPAQAWAIVWMLGCTLAAMGLIHPANRWQIAVGAVALIALFTALSLSAQLTGGQRVVAAVGMLVFVPFHILILAGAARHDPK